MKFFLVLTVLFIYVGASDLELYKKLKNEVKKEDKAFHKNGSIKVVIKNPKDTKLTKNVKALLKKQKIAQTTKKFEKILKD